MLAILYAISLTVKSLIIFLLPALIFLLMFRATTRSPTILFLFAAVCISNFLTTWVSFGVGHFFAPSTPPLPPISSSIEPAWTFVFPSLIPTSYALVAGLVLGFLIPNKPNVDRFIQPLLRLLVYLVPLFVVGFLAKLIHDHILQTMLQSYLPLFALILITQWAYLLLLYTIGSRFSPFKALKNMLPAAFTGFCSMSSAAALPLTLVGAEKNTGPSPVTKLAIPTTVSIHLIGDCIAIPLFAMALLHTFGLPVPTAIEFLPFALAFVLAKFSVAAIPGGGILVMLPLLESYFAFTPEMASLITAFYILFDPLITAANITGNGALSLILHRLIPLKRTKESL